ncbi:MAG: ATP-binding protein [Clostridia bacterium]|nr:ATP-binding protein [Clostridia bacterium]
MNRRDIVRQVEEEYARRREAQYALRDERIRELTERDPEIEPLVTAGPRLLRSLAGALLKDPEQAAREASSLQSRAAEMNRALGDRLSALGYPRDYLDVHYQCPVCRDTGYVEDPIRRECDCLQRAVSERAAQVRTADSGAAQTFSAFDESILPDDKPVLAGRTQRQQALLARNVCRRFADTYPMTETLGILLTGRSGLGKTFLLNCVDNELAARGFETVRTTAFQMFRAMRGAHFGEEEGSRAFERLTSCDMLLIDDLGTEPLMQNVTIEYLSVLLDERLVNRRHTVITTNLTPSEALSRYNERVFSRLFDTAHVLTVTLAGDDLRLHRR